MTKSSFTSKRLAGARRSPMRAKKLGVGERICVVRGALEGAVGTIFALKPSRRYVLVIDGLPRGVYLIVNADSVAKVESV